MIEKFTAYVKQPIPICQYFLDKRYVFSVKVLFLHPGNY